MIADYTTPVLLGSMNEESWGRYYRYNVNGDWGIVMPPRGYYFRDFNFGSWTDVAIGMIYCAKQTADLINDQADTVNEVQNPINVPNLFHFGLVKKQARLELDMSNLSQFIGLRSLMGGNSQLFAPPTKQVVGLVPTLVQNFAENTTGSIVSIPLNCGVSATPFSILGIRFTLNRDLGQIIMNYDTLAGTADAAGGVRDVLKDFLLAIPNTQSTSSRVFSGVHSTAPFSSYLLYCPWIDNRFKLQAVGGIKNG